jgi:hypothetical protein
MPTIGLINFRGTANECRLQLAFNSTEPIVALGANTCPPWPTVPDNFFFSYYSAKPALLQLLSYHSSHLLHMVVHLCAPDDVDMDPRTGRRRASCAPSTSTTTSAVTRRDFSGDQSSRVVRHFSGVATRVRGQREHGAFIETQLPYNANKQMIQLWADWYTLVIAKLIYHTHSDFSISAIHWQNIDSKTKRKPVECY